MNGAVAAIKALLLIGRLLHLVTWGESAIDDDTAYYCNICANHTMCLFPFDDPGKNCLGIENGNLDDKEIRWILHKHNSFRNDIVRSKKSHNVWSFSENMMKMFWDNELAKIARRWVLQCNIYDKDECRNLEQFPVMQNVNTLDLDDVGNYTAMERLEFHLKIWYDQLDISRNSLEYSMVKKVEEADLATPSLRKMGCARMTYNIDIHGERLSRVESLVCNYGPTIEIQGLLASSDTTGCKTFSFRYPELCKKLQGRELVVEKNEELSFRMYGGDENWRRQGYTANVASGTTAASFDYLFLVMLMLLLHYSPIHYIHHFIFT
ncbi:PREDICTED: venom allergen 3-like [Ceratosolen solmsi marchali]|uniref:Venom allergen 3-like n=1 Tax=Ceratosolen solmsi marchali TaxID=326594 RepID=A0AAJ6YN19_9HYME|nr:PREDICTED: venom allergen 3-like [Ceratosolen solmsi marchali]